MLATFLGFSQWEWLIILVIIGSAIGSVVTVIVKALTSPLGGAISSGFLKQLFK